MTSLIQGSAGASARALLPVQRVGEGEGGGGVALAPPPLLSERQRMAAAQAAVADSVGGLPEELGPSKGPDPSKAEVAAQDAQDMSQEAPDFVPNDESFRAWLKSQEKGGQKLEEQQAEIQELQAGKDEASEAGSEGTFAPELFEQPKPKPGRLARAGAALGRAGTSIKSGATRAGRYIWGGLSSAGGSIKRGFKGLFKRDNAQLGISTGGGAAATVKMAATEAAPAALRQPADLGQSVAAGGVELVHAVASLVGLFFQALKASFDIKSLVSSVRVVRALKQAKAQANEQARGQLGPEGEQIVEIINYAIRQKYEKIIKRAIGAAIALAAVGAALAVLIANPVGASVAALVLGVAGLSMTVYKLGRGIWKWKKNQKGEKRRAMAYKLHASLLRGDALAIEAVRALHLDPLKVRSDPNGDSMIFRKLKSF